MNPPAQRSVNLAQELRSGRHFGVFIDDTGSPGLTTPGLHAQRKSWVAVLVSPEQTAEVMDKLLSALSLLDELGLKDPEFHFTDIWAGKGEFAKLGARPSNGWRGAMRRVSQLGTAARSSDSASSLCGMWP